MKLLRIWNVSNRGKIKNDTRGSKNKDLVDDKCECKNNKINIVEENKKGVQTVQVEVVEKNEGNNDFKIFIGRRSTTGELVFYDPKREGSKLSNMNIMITGSSGKGKTQLLKSMIIQGRKKGANYLIFDFKNDFGDDEFLIGADLEYVDLEFKSLPYNPLIPPKKNNMGKKFINIGAHVYEIAGVFKDVYKLGPQQEAALKDVLREIYKKHGFNVNSKNIEFNNDLQFPILDEVGDLIKEKDIKAYNRLEPVFNYGLFSNESRQIALSDILSKSYVLSLNSITNDEIKRAISKLIVVSAHQYLNTLEHSEKIKNVFVFDEAHRFLKEPRLNTLIRECRAYGLAIWLSSQYPKDYIKEISGNLETKIVHGNDNSDENVNAIKEVTGFDGPTEKIINLGLFDSIVVNGQYNKAFVETLSYPHALILLEILKNGSIDSDSIIAGVRVEMKNELLMHLEKMEFISLSINNRYILTESGELVVKYFL
ncbi:ATP-binding protein [Clostridium sp. FP1]|uniref:ATP-binding protein n=1 Tax=Clostridium sp. FP1 TaxID=2724076 RepID=UPI0013E9722D|nr:type IV secretion system DNA-binding domain-containing protein [Clostridium sp. FP1]MBZ9634638.1 type IV secretion system DNA-binding domain-containing protein [Clostridium sp. FP1]